MELDLGEAEAIALAIEHGAEHLLIDEYAGRQIADKYGVKVVGIIGILIQARQKGIIDKVQPHIEELRKIGFRLNKSFIETVLKRLGEIR